MNAVEVWCVLRSHSLQLARPRRKDPGLPPRGPDKIKATVWSAAFSPDGSQLVVAVSTLVLVYSTADGDLVHRLRGHKDTVYTVDYAKGGMRFASGGADKTVIIWNSKGEGILKFTHNDSIQCIAYNPKSEVLLSCAASDFGLWSKEQKSVSKHKIHQRILCCDWSDDGNYMALGLFGIGVQIRDKEGAEKTTIQKQSPVFCVCWCAESVVVGSWDQTLSFWKKGELIRERKLNFYPCALCVVGGQYLMIAGSDCRVSICTLEGVRLATLCEDKNEWVWSVASNSLAIAVGSFGGAISFHQLSFTPFYAIAADRFATCERMTDVVVQHIASEKRVRIKSRDHVRHVALYQHRLAIQLPDRINIYELSNDHYRLRKDKLAIAAGDFLCCLAQHVVIGRRNRQLLHSYDTSSAKVEREWKFDESAKATAIRADGGQPRKEGIIVGLENGGVSKLYIDNPFPLELMPPLPGAGAILSAELSLDRKNLAILTAKHRLQLVELKSRKVLFAQDAVSGIAFNRSFGLCFSSILENEVSLRLDEAATLHHNIPGRVVGASETKVFVINNELLECVDLPQSQALSFHIERGDFECALRIASLNGVAAADWRRLAQAAARACKISIARSAFNKIHDMRHIELMNSMEQQQKKPHVFIGELLAYAGDYQDAAKQFSRAGEPALAIDMYVDLRQWEQAKKFATTSIDTRELIRRQAEWAEEIEDWSAAAEMYLSAGEAERAVKILIEAKLSDQLAQMARDKVSSPEALRLCAAYFTETDEDNYVAARDVLLKLDDVNALMDLYVNNQHWAEAMELASRRGVDKHRLYLPYAEYLALNDRFDEALDAYRRSGKPDQAARMMQQLTFNAVVESRFKDAAYYYWLLATENLRTAFESGGPQAVRQSLPQYQRHLLKADAYYAYSFVESFFLPFTSLKPDVLFNASRFLLNRLNDDEMPHGISRVKILFTLAKQAKELGAFKLARFAYDQLARTKVPAEWLAPLEVDMVTIHAKPVRDNPDLLPVCYRCGATNSLLNSKSHDQCSSCGHPYIRSFLNFDILPLVEFLPEPSISDDEALDLIRKPPRSSASADHFTTTADDDEDLFTKCINRTLSMQDGGGYLSVTADAETLNSLRREEVYACTPRHPGMRATFYKSALPDVHLAISQHRFFHEEDFEFAILRDGCCPFSRIKRDDLGDTGPC